MILYSVILSEKMNILDLVPQGLDIFGSGENFSWEREREKEKRERKEGRSIFPSYSLVIIFDRAFVYTHIYKF